RTELSIRGHYHGRFTGDCLAADPADDRRCDIGVTHSDGIALTRKAHHIVANIDIVVAGSEILSGQGAYRGVVAPGRVSIKRFVTVGSITVAVGVGIERYTTKGRVDAAGSVVIESIVTGRRVVVPVRVAKESEYPIGRIVATGGVV